MWRSIPGYEGLYEASNLGRIRSTTFLAARGRNDGTRYIAPRVYRQRTHEQIPYPKVELFLEGKSKTYLVHRLVTLTFYGPLPAGEEVRHLNGDARVNRLHNLAYGTKLENEDDKRRHGTLGVGSKHSQAVLNEALVAKIKWEIENGPRGTVPRLAVKHGVHQQTIYAIKAGRAWGHVGAAK